MSGADNRRLWRTPLRPLPAATEEVLRRGEFVECQQLLWGSNYTVCARLELDGCSTLAVYKPRRGERPLWDFPPGTLYLREYAAFLTSQALGWPFIPLTVIREGPYGVGSVQLYVEAEPLPSIRALQAVTDLDLARIAAFDQLTNNADRKGGHVLRDQAGRLWGIDHGLCFGAVARVRTVLQQFCGEPVPPPVLEELRAFRVHGAEPLRQELEGIIAPDEFEQFAARLDRLLAEGRYPRLDSYRSVPWPPF